MLLSKKNLPYLSSEYTIPRYNIEKNNNFVLHFGVGNFHRAHQALYIHEILNFKKNLAIIGINLRSKRTQKLLKKQNYLYSLIEISNNVKKINIINSIKKILYGPEDKDEIRKLISNENTNLITITVTEKGYLYNKISNSLYFNNEVKNDLNDQILLTLIGHLSFGLIERYKKNKKKINIVSCDNLSNNGKILKKVILDFTKRIDPEIAQWIKKEVHFPCTMVDGIVPNNIKKSKDFDLNFEDNALVVSEPYKEWYIESKNVHLKDILSNNKIKFVDDVSFYENIKLKILNASHSALSYIGLLLGYSYVHEAINDKDCYNFILNFLDKEVLPTIQLKYSFNINNYKFNVLNRFKNIFIADKLERISIDGSIKIPIRILDTFKNRKTSTKYTYTFLILAAWIKFLHGKNEKGENLVINDPNKNLIKKLSNNNNQFIEKILNQRNIFDVSEEDKNILFINIKKFINKIEKKGLKKTIIEINKS